MPCKITYKDQSARVDEYFTPTIRPLKYDLEKKGTFEYDDEKDFLTASFRGRPLLGKEVHIPKGFKGSILSKQDASSRGKTEKSSVKSYDKITYWNWDQIPSDSDEIVKAMEWIEVSKSIHG